MKRFNSAYRQLVTRIIRASKAKEERKTSRGYEESSDNLAGCGSRQARRKARGQPSHSSPLQVIVACGGATWQPDRRCKYNEDNLSRAVPDAVDLALPGPELLRRADGWFYDYINFASFPSKLDTQARARL